MDKVLFVQIAKVDVEKREVWGRAVQEVPDKTKEIFDYETSAPLFREWSAGFEKATEAAGQEKSLGNIRAMHGKVAAGKVSQIEFNDAEKAIDICATIVDDAEWQKCVAGVYTGFSIGGNYEKKWKDGDCSRYTARPAEISIVDNPCVPTAKFTMVKADGATEEKEFATPAAPAPDPAATGETAEKLAATKTDPAVEPIVNGSQTAAPVQKSMYDVARMADLLNAIASSAMLAQWEADSEGDGSAVPAQLREWLRAGLKILTAMTAEEAAELLASVTPKEVVVVELADKGDLAKRNAAQTIHDSTITMGASCSSSKGAESGDLAKVTGDLEKATADLTKMTAERDELQKKVEKLEAEPAAPKGVQRVVDKTNDVVDTKKTDAPEDNSPLALMKKAQANPQLIKL